MVKFKKYLLSLTLAFSILGWMCPDLQVSAAPAGHVHEWGSYFHVECVLQTEVISNEYIYVKDGRIYQVQKITEKCRIYKECYCGQRGKYDTEWRPNIREILIG